MLKYTCAGVTICVCWVFKLQSLYYKAMWSLFKITQHSFALLSSNSISRSYHTKKKNQIFDQDLSLRIFYYSKLNFPAIRELLKLQVGNLTAIIDYYATNTNLQIF